MASSKNFIDLSVYFDSTNKVNFLYFDKYAKISPKSQDDQEYLFSLFQDIITDLQNYANDDDDDFYFDDDEDDDLSFKSSFNEDAILRDIREINNFLKKATINFRFLQEFIDVLITYIDNDTYPDKITKGIVNCVKNMCPTQDNKLYLARELANIPDHNAIMSAANLYKECYDEHNYVELALKNLNNTDECLELAKYFNDNQEYERANNVILEYLKVTKDSNIDSLYILLFNNCMALGNDEKLMQFFNDFRNSKFSKPSSILKQAKILYNYFKPKNNFEVKRQLIHTIFPYSTEKEKKAWTSELKKVDHQEETFKTAQIKALEDKEREERERAELAAKEAAEELNRQAERLKAQAVAEAEAKEKARQEAQAEAAMRAQEIAELTNSETPISITPEPLDDSEEVSPEDIVDKSKAQIQEVIEKNAHKIPPHVSKRLNIQLKIDAKNFQEAYNDLRAAYMNAGDRDKVDIHHVLSKQLANKMPIDISELYFLQCEYIYRFNKSTRNYKEIPSILKEAQKIMLDNNLQNLWNKDYQIFINSHTDDDIFYNFIVNENDIRTLK